MAPKPKVAVFNRHASHLYGGAERYSLEVSKVLAKKYDVTYFCQTWEEMPENVKIHQVPRLTKKRMRWLNQLWFAIYTWWKTRNHFDVIHSHEMVWSADIQTIHCPPVKNKWVKATSIFQKTVLFLKIVTSLRQLTYFGLERGQFSPQQCKKIVAVSQLTKDELLAAYPQSAFMLEMILPGINAYPKREGVKEVNPSAKESSEINLLFVAANNFTVKGLDTVFESLKLMNLKIHLTVVGGGNIKLYRQKAEDLEIDNLVEFVGFQSDLAPFFRFADILVLPTREDTFSMIVLEAMYAGVPTIISCEKFCGIAAHLTNQETLKLQNPYDANELANAIQSLSTDSNKASEIAARGKSFADNHTWEKSAEHFDYLYQEIIKCKSI